MKDSYSIEDIQKIADKQKKKKNYRGWFEVFNAGNVPYNNYIFNMMSGSFKDCEAAEPEGSAGSSSDTSVGDAGEGEGVVSTAIAEDLEYQISTLQKLVEEIKKISSTSKYELKWYTAKNSHTYGLEFFKSLLASNKEFKKLAAKVVKAAALLGQQGPDLRPPHSKQIDANLYELRAELSSNIARLFYCFDQSGTIQLLNGFVKKTDDTPKSEIEKAKYLKQECLKER